MKHFLKLGMALLIAAIVLGFGACKFDDEGESGDAKGIDFKPKTGQNASIYVNNMTSKRLIAFKGEFRNDKIIGGVPGNSGRHGLPKPSGVMPSTPSDFPLLLLEESKYNANKNNLQSLSEEPFASIYVFYNAAVGDNDVTYEISSNIGGTKRIQILNQTGYNVEYRINGVSGQTLGYSPANMGVTNLYVNPVQYILYPVFKYFDPIGQQVKTILPRNESNAFWSTTVAASTSNIQLDAAQALQNTNANKTLGVAWIIVQNNAANAVEVKRGDVQVCDSLGFSYFEVGDSKTLQFDMGGIKGSQTFFEKTQVSNLFVVSSTQTVPIKDKNGETSFELLVDKQYQVTVLGSHNTMNTDPLRAEIDIDGAVSINVDELLQSMQTY